MNMDFLIICTYFLVRMRPRRLPGPHNRVFPAPDYSFTLLCCAAYCRGETPLTSLNALEK